jgi:hypothetical protein
LKAKVRASICMNDAEQYTGQGVTNVYDLEGTLVKHPWSGTFEITCIGYRRESRVNTR